MTVRALIDTVIDTTEPFLNCPGVPTMKSEAPRSCLPAPWISAAVPRVTGALTGTLLLASVLGLPSLPAQAQQAHTEVPPGLIVVTHIIRPGDTFMGLTQEYLGNTRHWRTVEELNPQMTERQLVPGERMQVLIDPSRVPLAARIAQRSGNVEAQPTPIDWLGAQNDDLLLEKDAARTGRRSSAELRLHDGTSVVITEESLVFLRALGRGVSTVSSNRRTQQVEVMSGQADLSSLIGANANREDVEVILGSSTLKLPKESPIRTRAVRQDDTAKIGLYEGEASFEGGGQTAMALAEGEGIVAAPGEEPKKEQLLDMPGSLEPAAGAVLVAGRPSQATWTAPPGDVASYTFEVCRDPSCGDLVARETGLTRAAFDIPDIAVGSYFWRVTAASPSGLDGYPSDARPISVVELPPDDIAPEVALDLGAVGVPYDGLPAFGPAVPLEVGMSDEGTGLARSGLLINGEEQPQGADFQTGRQTIAVFAVDEAGNRSETEAIDIFVDADAPSLRVEDREAPDLSGPAVERPKKRRAIRKAKKQGAFFPATSVFAIDTTEPLGYSLDGIEWRPLAALELGLLTDSSSVHLVLMDGFCIAATDAGGSGTPTCGRDFFTVRTDDEHTGVKVLSAVLEGSALTIRAEDEVGNATELTYRVTTRDGDLLPSD